jgi:1-acyl-sn-glycerol-3-phosphate acyltransferase
VSWAFRLAARLLSRLLLRVRVAGVERVPLSGGVLLAMNHLGGADPVLVIGYAPRPVTAIGKAEVLRWPVIGALARAYGMVPVRQGWPDRAALEAGLAALRSGEALWIAPEGRESLSGALERAKTGAAFLARLAGVPVVPVAITGTRWPQVLGAWRRLRRPVVTLTFGCPFRLPPEASRRVAADLIMRRIAELLPEEYRGVYR